MNETLESTIEVRPNTVIRVVYTHLGPASAPKTGSDWSVEDDWPRVKVELFLPGSQSGELAEYLHSDMTVLGYQLSAGWGQPGPAGSRVWDVIHHARTVRAAYDICRAHIDAAILVISDIIDSRNQRLAQRTDNICKSRLDSPFHHTD